VPETEILVTPDSGEGLRLDVFLAGKSPGLTRSQIKKSIEDGKVAVGGVVRRSSYKLRAGETVVFAVEPPAPDRLEPQDIPLKIIHQDADVIVLDKPAGLVVHPGAGNRAGTLANALLHHFPEISGIGAWDRPGIVHRLDKQTSGIMVVARSARAYESLLGQFKRRDVRKIYLGLAWGRIMAAEGRIDWPLGRHPKEGQKISIRTRNPKSAETFFRVLKTFARTTFLEIRPTTGRTHQIRVHLAAAGYPIVGDPLYGTVKAAKNFPRLFLHAHILSFLHPATGERLEFVSPLPDELDALLLAERNRRP